MNLLKEYLHYVAETEPPTIFQRWSFICAVGALLERNVSYGDGYFTCYPNLYVMLMGISGTRKSTAINLAKEQLKLAGFTAFSAEQTSKEKYLQDLDEQHSLFEGDSGSITTAELFGNSAEMESKATPNFIVAGEFNDFIGNGNIEFMSWLGNLWDWKGLYTKRLKTGKSVSIPNPTISLLAGNTATGFSLAFPPTAIGQGFFSRLILIHSDPSGRSKRKPHFPPNDIAIQLTRIRAQIQGNMKATALAEKLLDVIYENPTKLEDARFNAYLSRRYQQLCKVAMILTAMRGCMEITEHDVILANTILTHAEYLMPKALGEFGKARSSDVANTILGMIQNAGDLVTPDTLWSTVSQDIDNGTQFQEILRKLLAAGKIQAASKNDGKGGKIAGFLPIRKALIEKSEFIDFSLLTAEERNMKL